MELVSDNIRESVNTFKYNHLKHAYFFGSVVVLRYESPNISSLLNTKIYDEINVTHLDIRESIKIQMNEDMGRLSGFMSLNDKFFI